MLVLSLTLLAAGHLVAAPGPIQAQRRAAVLNRLGANLLIAPSQDAFKSDDQAGFQQATDFYYLTGLDDVVGGLLVLDGSTARSALFLPKANPSITRPALPPTPEVAQRMAVDEVWSVDSLGPWLERHLPNVSGVLVSPTDLRGAVSAPVPMANGVIRWGHYLTSLGYRGTVSSAIPIVRPLREIKDADEIATLARVGTASGTAMLAGIRGLRPGRFQRAVEVDIIGACVHSGARASFWPWAMTGPHAVFTDLFNSFVDYEGHNRAMKAGEVARVDVGCQLDHYMGDVGRTAPVSGRFTAGQREAWDLFIAGYRAGLVVLKNGAKTVDVYQAALDRIRALAHGLTTPMGKRAAEILLGPTGTQAWEIHGVGLDDAEGLPETLRAGMTVAYELMFAVDGDGFYLEDMILIEPNGYRLLTPGLPYTAAEIEAAGGRR